MTFITVDLTLEQVQVILEALEEAYNISRERDQDALEELILTFQDLQDVAQ